MLDMQVLVVLTRDAASANALMLEIMEGSIDGAHLSRY